MLEKRKSHAFNKDVYLIGQDEEGINYWLEAPVWDCGWYWGFGYIETYQNNATPNRARDIDSHQHFNGFVGQMFEYNFDKKCEVKKEYIHTLNDKGSRLTATVLTDSEAWELSDLMQRFYTMRKMADILHQGTDHLTSNTKHKTLNPEMRKWINEEELPALFKRVLEILSPLTK